MKNGPFLHLRPTPRRDRTMTPTLWTTATGPGRLLLAKLHLGEALDEPVNVPRSGPNNTGQPGRAAAQSVRPSTYY